MSTPQTELSVNASRVDFVRALRLLQKIERLEQRRATVTFSGGELTIALGEVAVSVHADGTWDGQVRIVGRDFRNLELRGGESGDPTITVTMRDGRFYVGPISCKCTWRNGAP